MASLILNDLLRRGAEVVSAERLTGPRLLVHRIVAMLISVFRVT
jgi:hypothetical protein